MSAQLSLPVLPVADPAWAEQIERERLAEERQRERLALVSVVREAAEGSEFYGYVTTAQVLECRDFPHGADAYEEPEAFRRMANRLRDLDKHGMVERIRGETHRGQRAPGLWGLP